MSASSIARAANDQQLWARVLATAHKEANANPTLAATDFGRQLALGTAGAAPLMWPVAVDTESAYEAALQAGRGAPGHDADIITDGALTASVVANWPPDAP